MSEQRPPPWGPTTGGGGWGEPVAPEPPTEGWGSRPDQWAHHSHDDWDHQSGGWDAQGGAQQWGQPEAPTWHAYDQPPPARYAGFWRRFWGLHADGVVVNLCTAIVNLIFFIVMLIAGSGFQSCDRFQIGQYVFERCSTSPAWVWGLIAGNVAVNLTVWYRVIPRAMGRNGHTWGMEQMGLTISDSHTNGILGSGMALGRAVLAGVFQIAPAIAATVVLVLADRDGNLHWSMIWLWIVIVVVLVLLPACWSLFDPRRQTLYDKAVGSVVTVSAEVNWFAVVAWAFSFLVPIFPLGIGFGHAAQSHASRHRHLRGSGMSGAALFVSYVQLLVFIGYLLLRFA